MTGHRLTVTDVGDAVRIGCTCTHQGALIPIESDPTHRADIWRTRIKHHPPLPKEES